MDKEKQKNTRAALRQIKGMETGEERGGLQDMMIFHILSGDPRERTNRIVDCFDFLRAFDK